MVCLIRKQHWSFGFGRGEANFWIVSVTVLRITLLPGVVFRLRYKVICRSLRRAQLNMLTCAVVTVVYRAFPSLRGDKSVIELRLYYTDLGFECPKTNLKIGALRNWKWRLLVTSCLSVRMEYLGFQSTDLHEIWYLSIFRKSVEKFKVLLKSDKNNWYFKWSRMCVYGNISLSFLRVRNVLRNICTWNQNTHFIFDILFPKIVPFMR